MHIDHNEFYCIKSNIAGYRFRKVKLGRLSGGGCSGLGVFVTQCPNSGPLGDAQMVKVDTVKWKVGTICPHLRKLFPPGLSTAKKCIASKTTCHGSPQGPTTQGACPNCKPFRMGAIPNGNFFGAPRVPTEPLRVRRHHEWVSLMLAAIMGAIVIRRGFLEEVTTIRCY